MRVNIREVTDKSEIIRAFSHLYTDRSKVLLWQSSKQNPKKKTLIYCELVSIDNRNIYVTPFNVNLRDILKKTVNTKNKIFIRGTFNGVLFKSDDFIIKGDKIEIPIPDRVLLSENRKADRIKISNAEYAYIKLINETNIKSHKRASHKIQDFSMNGFSIHMTKHESHHYEINRSYQINSIAGISCPKNFTAKLIYQKVHTYIKNTQSQVMFKAGFKTNKPIPKKLYDKLLSLAEKPTKVHKKAA